MGVRGLGLGASLDAFLCETPERAAPVPRRAAARGPPPTTPFSQRRLARAERVPHRRPASRRICLADRGRVRQGADRTAASSVAPTQPVGRALDVQGSLSPLAIPGHQVAWSTVSRSGSAVSPSGRCCIGWSRRAGRRCASGSPCMGTALRRTRESSLRSELSSDFSSRPISADRLLVCVGRTGTGGLRADAATPAVARTRRACAVGRHLDRRTRYAVCQWLPITSSTVSVGLKTGVAPGVATNACSTRPSVPIRSGRSGMDTMVVAAPTAPTGVSSSRPRST
jgi:hypothetical protein